jgi:hypothetical protein
MGMTETPEPSNWDAQGSAALAAEIRRAKKKNNVVVILKSSMTRKLVVWCAWWEGAPYKIYMKFREGV